MRHFYRPLFRFCFNLVPDVACVTYNNFRGETKKKLLLLFQKETESRTEIRLDVLYPITQFGVPNVNYIFERNQLCIQLNYF